MSAVTMPLTPAQRRVWAALEAFCREGRTCWPSQRTIGRHCGYSRKYVNRIIGELRDLGLLTIEKKRFGRWDRNVYTLVGRSA